MFMRTLRYGLAALVTVVLATGTIAVPVSAADPGPADPQCQLSAQVAFSVDPIGRVFGSGTVRCAVPVYLISVKVTLTQDTRIVGTDSKACQAQSTCDAVVSTLDPSGTQLYCATASGAYQLTPSGPTFDLGTKRLCRQG